MIQIRRERVKMQNIDTNSTIKYTKDLNVLYVEDDLSLQQQTKDFLDVLFASVAIANDGVEALKLYNKNSYDIVITDIKMPNMDGVTLSIEIKKINPDQCIIVTSAYNDSDDLQKFININIKQFMLKPIEVKNMLHTLYNVSKNIVNDKMVEIYRKNLEKANSDLKTKNEELQSLVRILDSKIAQIAKDSPKIKDIDFNKLLIEEKHLKELKDLEIDISGAAVLISLSKNISTINIKILGEMFISYAKLLDNYKEYKDLTQTILKLGNSLNNAPQNFIKRVENISILLESFIYVLRMWRKNLVSKNSKKAFELHPSMINDITTIINIIDGTQ